MTGRLRPLPDFVIIGTARGGTTSLFRYLAQHPQVERVAVAAVQRCGKGRMRSAWTFGCYDVRHMMTDTSCRLASVFALASALTACSGAADEGPLPLNVLLISIDTLRSDHLGCYGYDRPTSPRLDEFAEQSLRYSEARAPAPWTLPSHAGLLSGRHPHEIGVRHFDSALPDSVELLAERLAEEGFQTAAFVDSGEGGFVGAERGFDRGFQRYEHAPFVEDAAYKFDAEATVDAAKEWLGGRNRRRPFFLFLHTKSVHTTPLEPELVEESDAPYHKPAAFRTRFLAFGEQRFSWTDPEHGAGGQYLKALNERIAAGEAVAADVEPERVEELVAFYDGGIAYTDRALGRLFDWLDDEGLADSTLVVVTADHGEAFGEHELFLHKEVFEPLLRVPLLVRDPRAAPGVVSEQVTLMDVVPTVLERVGMAQPEGLSGVPLPTSDGSGAPRLALASYESGKDEWYRAAALLDGPWKLVMRELGEGPERIELFHLPSDPDEALPRTDEEARYERMSAALDAWLKATVSAAGERLELDEETLEQLRALGYGK